MAIESRTAERKRQRSCCMRASTTVERKYYGFSRNAREMYQKYGQTSRATLHATTACKQTATQYIRQHTRR
eukprot:5400181-Pleurochrysis_carterae.AAC.1